MKASRVAVGSSNPTPGHVSGENHGSKGYLHPSVHCRGVYNSQDMEATQMYITEERIMKMYIYTIKYYLPLKRMKHHLQQ